VGQAETGRAGARRTSDASTLQQYHDHRHEAPTSAGTAEQRALDLVRGLASLMGVATVEAGAGKSEAVDVENLEQDEGADEAEYRRQ
jgi:hypothetical protein